METLREFVQKHRSSPRRRWNFASSAHWYDDEQFWVDLCKEDSIYKQAMLDTEDMLIDKVVQDIEGAYKFDTFVALGPGDGSKEQRLRDAVGAGTYVPIDVNQSELELAVKTSPVTTVPLNMEFQDGLSAVQGAPNKFIYLGATFSNLSAFGYDLLGKIWDSMLPGDACYLSVQTLPHDKDLPLILAEYEQSTWHESVVDNLAGQLGIQDNIAQPAVELDPRSRMMEISVVVDGYAGKKLGFKDMKNWDELVLMTSHKPRHLQPMNAGMWLAHEKIWQAENQVCVDNLEYTSTFEGGIWIKPGSAYPVTLHAQSPQHPLSLPRKD